jgi:hypothetical protein
MRTEQCSDDWSSPLRFARPATSPGWWTRFTPMQFSSTLAHLPSAQGFGVRVDCHRSSLCDTAMLRFGTPRGGVMAGELTSTQCWGRAPVKCRAAPCCPCRPEVPSAGHPATARNAPHTARLTDAILVRAALPPRPDARALNTARPRTTPGPRRARRTPCTAQPRRYLAFQSGQFGRGCFAVAV